MAQIIFAIHGPNFGAIGNLGIPAFLYGRTLFTPPTRLIISGVTRDSTGAILGSCSVALYRTSDDVLMERVTSDNSTGAYSFSAVGLSETYYVTAYKAGAPDLAGTTVNTLTGA